MSTNSILLTLLGLLLTSLLTFTACSNPGSPTDSDLAGISGSWLWISSVGGFAPQVITPPPGTRFADFYSSHGSFSRRRNDTLVMTAQFSLANESTGMLVKYTDVQTYQGFRSDMWDAWVDVQGDTLYLSDNGCDMYRHTYVRIR